MKKLVVVLIGMLLVATLAAASGTELPQSALRITEVMASNKLSLEDAFGRKPDWIEICNTSDTAISLQGVCLSDDESEPDKYRFPDDAVIQPGEYVIVFASGAKKDIADEYHTSFKLDAAGEMVVLSFNGTVLDILVFEGQQSDVSLALDDNNQFQFTITPTPGYVNIITASN